jgi:hypothetical protein
MRTVLWGMALIGLSSVGCIWDQSFAWPPGKKSASEALVKPSRSHAPAVRPEQVTPENAFQIARALEEELDADTDCAAPASRELNSRSKREER